MSDSPNLAGLQPQSSPRAARGFRIAGRRIRPDLNRVEAGDRTIQVEPKIMQVLVCLADAAGEVVTKDELLRRVWQDVYVTDDVLVRAVSELRKLLEDEGGGRVIDTIRKRGYRLATPVVYEIPRAGGPSPGEPAVVPRRRWLAAAALLAVVVAAVGLVVLSRPADTAGPTQTRASVPRSPRFSPVTALDGNEFHPAVSPDGTRVAFVWAGGGHADRPTDVYVRLLDSPTQIALTRGGHDDRAPVWSPDGTRVAFLRFDGGCEIDAVSALGGPIETLAACTDDRDPRVAWSPDGRWLAATRAGPGSTAARLVRLPIAGGAPEPVTGGAGEFRDTAPSFSPDGTTIAFVRELSGAVGDVYSVPASGGEATRLTFDNAEVIGVTWIEEGRRIAFSSNRAGMFSLWAVATSGGEPELLAGGGRKMKHPSASLAGDAVAYEAWDYEMNLYALPVGGGSGRRLAPASDEWTFDPRYSPDGAWIAFASTRSGAYEIWICRSDGSEPRPLTSFRGPYVGQPRWSPDGRRLVFVARPEGRADLWMADVSGGAPRRLTRHPQDESVPSWSADGERVYFASRRTGAWQVFEQVLDTGEERAVTETGGYAALESPDGRWLYYTRSERAGLWRRARGGGELGPEEVVTPGLQPEDWAAWGVGPSGAWWLESGREGATVVLGRPGESPTPLVSLPDLAWPGFDLSPDGRGVAYSRLDRHDSNILLVSWRPPDSLRTDPRSAGAP